MVVQTAELIFNDTKSKYNQDLTDFLERNLDKIITLGQITFKFKIVNQNNMAQLRQRGITRLPAMIFQNRSIISVPKIIEELRFRVKNSKGIAPTKSEEEVLDDYFRESLGNINHDSEGKHILPDDDDDGDQLPDFGALVQRELKRRNGETNNDDNYNNNNNRRRPPPQQPQRPNRNQMQDDDNYEPMRPTNNIQQREDNLTNEPGDAMTALNNMPPSNSADDDMMRALLERMGGDGGYDV